MIRSVITMGGGHYCGLELACGHMSYLTSCRKTANLPFCLAHGVRIVGLLLGVLCTTEMPLKRWSPRSSQGEVLRSLGLFSSVGVGKLLPWPSKK